jgi:hypothetical protein
MNIFALQVPTEAVGEVVSTSAVSASTTGSYGPGRVQVIASQLTYMMSGAAPTAVSGTSFALAPNLPYWFDLNKTVKLAFVAGGAGTATVHRMG